MRAFPVLVLAASLFAGCLSTSQPLAGNALDKLSQPVFDLAEDLLKEPLEVLAADGVALDTFVYRPATDLPVPAILIMSPYFSNGAGRWGVANQDEQDPPGSSAQIIRYFVPRGYAVVMNSVRGTGFSGGCFSIGGPEESKDHVAVVEAIIGQGWSNGAVAGYGGSYVGATVVDLLTEGHAAVKTGVPYAAVTDWYRYNFVNAVPINPQGYSFNYYYERDVAIVPPYNEPGMETVQLAAENANCDHSDVQRGGFESAATGDKGPYWQARDFNQEVAGIQVPVFVVHGLQDWNVKPDHLLPWTEALRAQGGVVKEWLGQWAHNRPNANTYNKDWTRGEWNLTLLRWFDHHLKGIDTGILQEPLVDVQDDQGVWRREAQWPPERAALRLFYLGAAQLQDKAEDAETVYRDLGLPIPNPPEALAAHYATWSSEALEEDLRISGEGKLRLRLAHDAPSGTVAATLWDLAPNGTARRINFAFLDLEHRAGLERGEPVQPGEPFDVEVWLFPQDDVVLAGHRLALTLSGNDAPATCWYTAVDVPSPPPILPVQLPLGVVGAASYPCVEHGTWGDDPGPFMQPMPSGGATHILGGEGSHLELPILPSIAPFVPETEEQRVEREGA